LILLWFLFAPGPGIGPIPGERTVKETKSFGRAEKLPAHRLITQEKKSKILIPILP
jgi:hypothetical protein